MSLKFHKMHGAGNDFVLLDLRRQDYPLEAHVARRLADRHTGIGCDQLLVLRRPSDPACLADFEVWNADGSRAEQCGNGVRCIGLYLASLGEAPGGEFHLHGPAGIIGLDCLGDGQVRVDMGVPEFEPGRIPVSGPATGGRLELETGDEIQLAGAVSMGNPHALVRVGDIRSAAVGRLGPLISRHPDFPAGCNAGFAEVIDRGTIRLRVFERGTGETRACGSGACAAAAILRRAGLLDERIQVLQDGGTLIIDWRGEGSALMMTGPARHVFEGTLK